MDKRPIASLAARFECPSARFVALGARVDSGGVPGRTGSSSQLRLRPAALPHAAASALCGLMGSGSRRWHAMFGPPLVHLGHLAPALRLLTHALLLLVLLLLLLLPSSIPCPRSIDRSQRSRKLKDIESRAVSWRNASAYHIAEDPSKIRIFSGFSKKNEATVGKNTATLA